jgi:hypothetical protein
MSGNSTHNGGDADLASIRRRESLASADSHTAKEYVLFLHLTAGLLIMLTEF